MIKYSKYLLILFICFSLLGFQKVYAVSMPPEISAQTAITVDVDSGEIIYAKNIDKRMYPASTTKLMTALIFADKKSPSDILNYSINAKAQEAVGLYLTPGEKVKASDAMNAMLLYSANDIAYMIAENYDGKVNDFVELMNEKAKELNLKNTHFVTPNGLHDNNHYSSAYDLSVIARELFKNKYYWVLSTIEKQTSVLKTSYNRTIKLENRNKLLGKDGCIGGKTGYTSLAGKCLVTLYERNATREDGSVYKRRLVGIVLKSENDTTVFDDMKKIINWSYAEKKSPLYKKNTVLRIVSVSYKTIPFIGMEKSVNVPLIIKEDAQRYENGLSFNVNVNVNELNPWTLNKNVSVGSINITDRKTNNNYKLYPAISRDDIIKDNLPEYIRLYAAMCAILSLTSLTIVSITLSVSKKINTYKNNTEDGKYI